MDPLASGLSRLRWLLAAAWLALAAGCAGSGSDGGRQSTVAGDTCSGDTCGTLLIGLTDADGDFVSYSVDVLSVALERRNGAVVETLPATTRVDFAQLTELTDVLSVATLVPGDYVRGTIRLDYTNAEVFVERGGEVVEAAVVDENGEPLGVAEVDIRLADRNHLVITRGRAAFLGVDFDLVASHDVDVAQSPPVVTARPYIVAEVQPLDEKELRLRGALVDVDTAASSYTIDVRPWFRRDGSHGRMTVNTTGTTTFEIDGVTATGAAGLEELAKKPAGTLTIAFGALGLVDRAFTADLVYAGDSVGGVDLDAVHGNVVSRNGDTLTVKGAFAVRRDFDARLHRTVVVEAGPDTVVLKTGMPGTPFDTSAISVGQHIVAFGTFTPPASAGEPGTLDATAGRVRLLPTHLRGTVQAVVPGQLNLELRAIDRLGVEAFDFAGTGTTAATDADPSAYEVATGTLGLASLGIGEAAKVVGYVNAFGAAPPDFEGRTIVDRRDLPAALVIGWGTEGTVAPFVSIGATGIVLDLANPEIGARHSLVVGMRLVDLLDLPASPTIAPAAGRALFGVSVGGRVELFATYGELVAEINLRLASGERLRGLTASGTYDEGTSTLSARRIAAHFAAN